MWFDGNEYEYGRAESRDLTTQTESTDLTSYLLGERSELRPLLEAISRAQGEHARQRMALEYLLVLASARHAARGQAPEPKAMAQVRAQYGRVFARDHSEHAELIKALHAALSEGASLDILAALKLLGLYHRQQGSYGLARAGFGVATELAARVGDPHEELNTLFWLGITERYLGQLDRAEAIHRQQLRLARRVGAAGQAVLAQENLGLISLRRGRIGEARDRVSRALSEARELEDSELQGYCYHALMLIESDAGRPGQAAICVWEAYIRYESMEQQLRALQDCAALLYDCRLYDSAQAAWEIILLLGSDAALAVRSKIGLADIAVRLDDQLRFNQLTREILTYDKLPQLSLEHVEALRTIGLGLTRFGERDGGRRYLMKSLDLAQEVGYEKLADEIRVELETSGTGSVTLPTLEIPEAEYAQLRSVARSVMEERARRCA